nr:immunoglobulin heavy chain junction region [Macaca mulatta]MOW24157.1 immunoglobulin heavy chain junction region [Macaca mulatta]MOW25428.1 immunoglobulin heavy chain junction region [Macaca mulatta]MOW26876.1 immunoglobulin heavy chain junction region [Macaca mulatta]
CARGYPGAITAAVATFEFW